uniref:Uncharacterized protein n=1 Tax=Anguilla anguilla TaxID=7936 RepID=A0A0E9TP34_ANGAN
MQGKRKGTQCYSKHNIKKAYWRMQWLNYQWNLQWSLLKQCYLSNQWYPLNVERYSLFLHQQRPHQQNGRTKQK